MAAQTKILIGKYKPYALVSISNNNMDDEYNLISSSDAFDTVIKHNLSLSPNAPKQLSKSTIHRYVSKGLAGMSPIKRGPPSQIPLAFEKVIALHCRMIQNSLSMFILLYMHELID